MTDDGAFVRRSSYQPGTRAAIAGVNAYLLGEADPVGVIVTEVWSSFKEHFGTTQVTEILRGKPSALGTIPNFGLVAESDGDILVVLRGDTLAEVRTGDSKITLTCPISTTIAVYRLPPARLRPGHPRCSGPRYPSFPPFLRWRGPSLDPPPRLDLPVRPVTSSFPGRAGTRRHRA